MRPKIGQKVRFKQIGTQEIREGTVKYIESPRFQKHLQRTQYEVESEGKLYYLNSNELIGYVR